MTGLSSDGCIYHPELMFCEPKASTAIYFLSRIKWTLNVQTKCTLYFFFICLVRFCGCSTISTTEAPTIEKSFIKEIILQLRFRGIRAQGPHKIQMEMLSAGGINGSKAYLLCQNKLAYICI